MKKEILKNTILFLIFGAIYCGMEIIWRGYSDISMAIVGGCAAMIIGTWNEKNPSLSIWRQCVCGMCLITLFEGVSGLILNVWLKLGIWDYSNMPGQFFWGQCCLPFCVVWFVLSAVAIFLDDWLRWLLFNE